MNESSSMFELLYQDLKKWPDPDVRTDDWLFMKSPGVIVAVCLAYFYITWKGPKWMEKQKPWEFSTILTIYNVILVILSVYISYEVIVSAFLQSYTLIGCQPVDYSFTPTPSRLANVIWWYFVSKIIELLDSVFFILRKKNNQLTFLHVYHHGTMPIVSWIAARYITGGSKVVACAFNSSVHIVMYAYYALAALGPGIQKYLWWKRYITRLQLIQFMVIMIHSLWALTIFPCSFPKLVHLWLVGYAGTFLVLFGNFYMTSYKKKVAASAALKKGI